MTTRHSSHGSGGGVNVTSLLMLIAGGFAVIAALLARSGFTGRDHVVGIDLGTTYSVIGISQKNNVTIIPDEYGHLIIPSIVSFVDGGKLLVGRPARAHRTKDPKHTIYNAKRFIGRSFEDVKKDNSVGSSTSPYDFTVTADDNKGDACFQLDLKGHPSCISPIEIGAHVVRKLRSMAEAYVAHNQINKAVIAVPVDFDSKQREATVQAFKNAGFFVARILEEPTAAAIAYGLHKDPSISFIIVFDFGGGTLDVSLLYARSGSINVVDTIGDNNLGGEDVDATIADYLAKHIAEQIGSPIKSTGSDMEEQDSERVEDPNELPCTRAGIRRAAELVKRKLSSTKNARVECIVQTDGKKKKTGDKITVELTREQLETFCANLFERTLVPVKEILEKNAMSQKDIDEVVLVGGSSRIPWIRENLKKLFGGRAPRSDIDPDVAVAYGAARTLD